jgi:hypothetical protein
MELFGRLGRDTYAGSEGEIDKGWKKSTLHHSERDGEVLHWRVHDFNSRPGRKGESLKGK